MGGKIKGGVGRIAPPPLNFAVIDRFPLSQRNQFRDFDALSMQII